MTRVLVVDDNPDVLLAHDSRFSVQSDLVASCDHISLILLAKALRQGPRPFLVMSTKIDPFPRVDLELPVVDLFSSLQLEHLSAQLCDRKHTATKHDRIDF